MVNSYFSFVLISLLALTITSFSVAKASKPSTFIKSSCRVTRYPTLCIKSLSNYSKTIQESPKTMAQVALSVSLSKATSARKFVIQMSKSKKIGGREYQVMKDCVENVGDSVDRLSKSINELGNMGHGEESFLWHMSNVQTWVSAALTEENTCMDGFDEGSVDKKLKLAVRHEVIQVAMVISNALALVNRFADNHQDDSDVKITV